MGLWGFLSICVIAGVIFAMFSAYLDHKKAIKKLELDAQSNNTSVVNEDN